jgi:flagella basal body P-ring formation protein FlgA
MHSQTVIIPCILGLALSLALSRPADAGVEVRLAAHPTSRGAQITLSDLFEGVEGPAADIVVGTGARVGGAAVLDAGDVQLAAHRAGLDWDNARGVRRIVVEGGAPDVQVQKVVTRSQPARSATVTRASAVRAAQAPKTVQLLAYTRNIAAGEPVSDTDVNWADVIASESPYDSVMDPDMLVGKVARRPLRAGAPALKRDIVGAKIIHRDEIVSVVFRDEGMRLSLHGRAMTDAAAGESVQVMNLASKKILEAVAVGPGEALVGPDADLALKSRYASLR